MWPFKKGFTLIEVLVVIGILTISFSIAVNILSTTSNGASLDRYIEKDLDNIKNILGQIKYLKISGQKDIFVRCDKNQLSLSGDQFVDQTDLKYLSCSSTISVLPFQNQSGLIQPFSIEFKGDSLGTNYTVSLNKYGYALINKGI